MPAAFPFDKFKKGLIKIGLNETNYYENLSDWMEKNPNTEQSKKDFFWYLYQSLLSSVAKNYCHDLNSMYELQRNIYCEMFSFLVESGKDSTVAQKGINHCDIQKAALSELKMDGEIIGGNRCKLASKITGKTYSLKALLIKDAIPYDRCSREGGCTCNYGFRPLRDSNGKLIGIH